MDTEQTPNPTLHAALHRIRRLAARGLERNPDRGGGSYFELHEIAVAVDFALGGVAEALMDAGPGEE